MIPEPDEHNSGLTERGCQRRKGLIDAALQVLIRDGHHGVTLRSVSLEAKASHGSVNYYFGSRGALLCAATESVCHRIACNLEEVTPLLEQSASDPDQFASVLAEHNIKYMVNDRSLSLAVYELTLAGARDHALRGVLAKWGKVHSRLTRNAFLKLGSADPESDYAFLLNSLGGLIVAQLAIPRRNFEARILRPSLVRLIRSIANDRPSPEKSNRGRSTVS